MTRDELLELIAEIQQLQSELDDIEVKTAQGGTPQRLYEPLSAFANHSGGGVILFGLDESRDFEIVDSAVNQVLANIRKSSLIEGVYRRDIPEYPERAVREAIVNAIAHRDYSPFVRGSYIQIRLFADRLEIQSPGGLYGNVSVESAGDCLAQPVCRLSAE